MRPSVPGSIAAAPRAPRMLAQPAARRRARPVPVADDVPGQHLVLALLASGALWAGIVLVARALFA